MKKYIFAAVALFLALGSALLFTEMATTYSTLVDEDETETSEIAIAPESTETGAIVNVRMETSMGEVLLELYPEKAPETVRNFLSYTNAGTYDGTLFHRIISGFMNQGGGYKLDYEEVDLFQRIINAFKNLVGGYTPDYAQVEMQRPIPNEAYNGLKNLRGTIAMARTSAPHSATSQFFINTADNSMLDHTGRNMSGWGYAVFGKVVSGMEVIDNMAAVQTGSVGPFSQDAPLTPIIIQKMTEVK